jgi:ABC-type sugar transport system substrate-binding protein
MQKDGIVMFVNNLDALASTITEIYDAGIPIVNAIAVSPETRISAFINTSQAAKGAMIARNVAADATAAGRDAYVMVLTSSADVQSFHERLDGFLEEAENHPNVHIVDIRRGAHDDERLNIALESLLVNEEINTIYGPFQGPMVVAVAASEQMNRDVMIYGIDGDEPTLRMLAEGRIQGIHVQFPRPQASLCLFTLLRVINGDNLPREVWEPEVYATNWAGPQQALRYIDILYPR